MSELILRQVRSLPEMLDALAVRRQVFIEEQGVQESLEVDHHDADPAIVTTAIHIVGYLEGRPVATGRLLLDSSPGEYAHIGRVAVLKEWRELGLAERSCSRYRTSRGTAATLA